jgi:hypothetical protein
MGAVTGGMLSAELGGRDSNPDSQDQNLMSCHWTTPQEGARKNRSCAGTAIVSGQLLRYT